MKHVNSNHSFVIWSEPEMQSGFSISFPVGAEVPRLTDRTHSLTNFLWSRKRAVEDADLRKRAVSLEKELWERAMDKAGGGSPAHEDPYVASASLPGQCVKCREQMRHDTRTFSLSWALRWILQMSMSSCWRIVSERKWFQSSEEPLITGRPSSMPCFCSTFALDINVYCRAAQLIAF